PPALDLSLPGRYRRRCKREASMSAGPATAQELGMKADARRKTHMVEDANELVRRVHRADLQRLEQLPAAPGGAGGLPDMPPGSPLGGGWDVFRRDLPQLLADGYARRFALLKEGHPTTVWDTLRDAAQAARLLFPGAPSLVQEIWPTLRPLRVGGDRRRRN